jgi:hypothetical protein
MKQRVHSDSSCYFAGGTSIALLAGEHRESVDIDFLCTTRDGMRELRTMVTNNSIVGWVSAA